jgi:hypothetical protein
LGIETTKLEIIAVWRHKQMKTGSFLQEKRPCRKSYGMDYFFARKSFTWSLATMFSLKVYAPVFSDLTIRITFAKSLPEEVLSVATTFFAMVSYLFNFLMNSHFLEDGIIFLNLKPLGCVLFILGGNVP